MANNRGVKNKPICCVAQNNWMEGNELAEKVTRKTIAEITGTSISVVSRALNNSGYVEAKKKKDILRVADELGYVRNPVTLSLEEKRTKQILFYCKDLSNAFNVELYYGMVKAAKARGYMALLNANLKFDNIKDALIDGIILQNNYFTDLYCETYGKNYHLPVVGASFGIAKSHPVSIPVIEWDMEDAMNKAIDYLRKRGHKKIAFGSQYAFDDRSIDLRGLTWKRTMKEVFGDRLEEYFLDVTLPPYSSTVALEKPNIDAGEDDEIYNEETYADKGRIAARIFLDRQLDATAVICFNDEYTLGFMNELQRSGLKIPDDLSILSFDGIERRKIAYPKPVSISPDPIQFGFNLANLLLDRIEHKKIHYYAKQPIRITAGESVKDIRGKK